MSGPVWTCLIVSALRKTVASISFILKCSTIISSPFHTSPDEAAMGGAAMTNHGAPIVSGNV